MADRINRLDRLEALMREPPAEYFYALDAKAEAEKADPNYVPTPVAWREDEDPFGMDWAWIDEPDRDRSTSPEHSDG